MSTIISNTSPIIALCIIQKLDVLWKLFDEVYVPQGVYDEIIKGNAEHLKGKKELIEAVCSSNIKIYTVKDELFVNRMIGKLHKGEVETIVGGLELNSDFVLIDERAARLQAKNSLLIPIGTLGVLRIAKQRKIIREIKPYIDILISQNYRISKNICERILKGEGEL